MIDILINDHSWVWKFQLLNSLLHLHPFSGAEPKTRISRFTQPSNWGIQNALETSNGEKLCYTWLERTIEVEKQLSQAGILEIKLNLNSNSTDFVHQEGDK